ncbi:hypothetical protein M9H77_20474 [Catharanthus roseus]|uniref:Uncharacterized protein n=1 Tax=Catharanthus roseus TaxID=4058 RepID=A0ACC0AKA8_CATRO|nr:hypothetical protein M9H77_20474 [Catharanthus roseus]
MDVVLKIISMMAAKPTATCAFPQMGLHTGNAASGLLMGLRFVLTQVFDGGKQNGLLSCSRYMSGFDVCSSFLLHQKTIRVWLMIFNEYLYGSRSSGYFRVCYMKNVHLSSRCCFASLFLGLSAEEYAVQSHSMCLITVVDRKENARMFERISSYA